MFYGLSLRKSLAYMLLMLLFAIQNPISNEVPLLFLRTNLECLDGESWIICQEYQICEGMYSTYRWVGESYSKSITMQFNFICESRITEATIQFLGPVAQMIAFFITIFREVPKQWRLKVILYIFTIESCSLMLLKAFSSSLFFVTLIWTIWNFLFAFFYSQILCYVEEAFPKKLSMKTPVIMNILWPLGGIAFVCSTLAYPDSWIDQCVYLISVPVLCCTIIFYLLTKRDDNNQQSQNLLANDFKQGESKNALNEMKERCLELCRDKTSLKNLGVYLVLWVVSSLGYCGTFIAFNKVSSESIQKSILFSIFAELAGSLMIMYLLMKFDSVKILRINFFVIGAIQAATLLLGDNIQMIVILATKISNKIMFASNLNALQYWLHPKYIVFTFSISNIVSIIANSLLPFYKYYMDQSEVNFFSGIGIASILCAFSISYSTIVRDPNRISAERKQSICTDQERQTILSITPITTNINVPHAEKRFSEIISEI